jgi:hypothetical protein
MEIYMEKEVTNPKFKHGDLCKVRTSGQTVMVIGYKTNMVGAVINYFSGEDKYPAEVRTDDVLCEFDLKGTNKRQYFKEANLELLN